MRIKDILRIVFVLLVTFDLFSQNVNYSINNEIVSLLPDSVKIVALGDPTHQEGNKKTCKGERI